MNIEVMNRCQHSVIKLLKVGKTFESWHEMQRMDIALVKPNDSKTSRSFEKVTELNTQQWHSEISLNCSDVVPM